MNLPACSILTAILLVCPLVVLADEAADTFNKLYGEDLKRVAATPLPADDIALAKQMLEDAKKAADQPAFLTLLYEKAYELASKDPSGYATATAAMDLLAGKVPGKKVECLQKSAAIYQKQYATARAEEKTKAGEDVITALGELAAAQTAAGSADAAGMTLRQAVAVATAIKSERKAALQAQLDSLASQRKVERQIALLKAKLDADPKDVASRTELARLYLVERDDPGEAAPLIDESTDPAMRKYVPAAAKPVEDAPEVACMELGGWYMGLADQAATPPSKGAMLRRAQAYYQRYLDLHTSADLARTAATLTLKKVEDALAKLGPAAEPKSGPAPGLGWIDCLNLVDLKKAVVAGNWTMAGRVLEVDARTGLSKLVLPVTPPANYELEAAFVRTEGEDSFCFRLPAGPSSCNLHLSGFRGQVSGLETVRGQRLGGNEACVRPGKLENGREYIVNVRVEFCDPEARIAVVLDGKPLFSWKGPASDLAPVAVWTMPDPKCLGLGAANCQVRFNRVRMRSLPKQAQSGPAVEPKSGPSTVALDLGNGVTMKLVPIRPGKFMMGSPDSEEGRRADEGPQHEVTISKPFYMGATEVTQAQYEAVMGTNPSQFKGPTNPVELVSWNDAAEFCRKLSEKTRRTVRLPTEAEWEYACRAGTRTRFSFGDSDSALDDYAWRRSNSGGTMHPVGQKKPNALGLYDMHGNVSEWCADWYGPYSSEALTDPQGAGSGNYRVLRGGPQGDDDTARFRCASRRYAPNPRDPQRGFRCAMTP